MKYESMANTYQIVRINEWPLSFMPNVPCSHTDQVTQSERHVTWKRHAVLHLVCLFRLPATNYLCYMLSWKLMYSLAYEFTSTVCTLVPWPIAPSLPREMPSTVPMGTNHWMIDCKLLGGKLVLYTGACCGKCLEPEFQPPAIQLMCLSPASTSSYVLNAHTVKELLGRWAF